MSSISTEELGFEVARFKAEAEVLRYENETLRTTLNRLSVERDQLQSRIDAMTAGDYQNLYILACEELEECESAHEELRGLVCSRSDECVDFCSLVDNINDRYNPDD